MAFVLHLLPAGWQSLRRRNWFVLDSPLSCLRRSSSFSQRAWSVPKPSVRGSPGATGASVGADRWYESRAAAAADGVGLPAAGWLAAGWAGEASTGEYWKAGGAGRAAGDSCGGAARCGGACGAGCAAASCGPHVAGAAVPAGLASGPPGLRPTGAAGRSCGRGCGAACCAGIGERCGCGGIGERASEEAV